MGRADMRFHGFCLLRIQGRIRVSQIISLELDLLKDTADLDYSPLSRDDHELRIKIYNMPIQLAYETLTF